MRSESVSAWQDLMPHRGTDMARVTVIDDSEEFLALMQDVLSTLGHEMARLPGCQSLDRGDR